MSRVLYRPERNELRVDLSAADARLFARRFARERQRWWPGLDTRKYLGDVLEEGLSVVYVPENGSWRAYRLPARAARDYQRGRAWYLLSRDMAERGRDEMKVHLAKAANPVVQVGKGGRYRVHYDPNDVEDFVRRRGEWLRQPLREARRHGVVLVFGREGIPIQGEPWVMEEIERGDTWVALVEDTMLDVAQRGFEQTGQRGLPQVYPDLSGRAKSLRRSLLRGAHG